MSQALTVQRTLSHLLGEGLQWHAPSGRWWWTDIEGRSLQAWTPGQTEHLVLHLPDRLGCFTHTRSGALLLGFAKYLAVLKRFDAQAVGEHTLSAEALQVVCPVEAHTPSTRVNDGRCDRAGNFVFGTLDEAEPRQAIAHYYQYSNAHGLRRLAIDPIRIANSVCFSPDGRQMYYADSPLQTIWVCDYDAATAHTGSPRVFVQWQGPQRDPDGSVIDAEGCLWNAEWGTGTVVRYGPDGRELARYVASACNTTCPALGGPQGDELMVTTARVGLSTAQLAAQPLSGSLFGARIAAGLALAEPLFADA